jgi:hypothetical protein
MKTVALYMRVSTVDQHPETQLHDLRAMAHQRGFTIVHEYTDRISGTKAKRPGLDELLRDARRGRFQVVLVCASDRIARSVRHFLEVLDQLNHLNVLPSGISSQLSFLGLRYDREFSPIRVFRGSTCGCARSCFSLFSSCQRF